MWCLPIKYELLPTGQDLPYIEFALESLLKDERTLLPLPPHPGAFGVTRRYHRHEGVDLYCRQGTAVHAVEDGIIVAILVFTGPRADPPSPWWNATEAVLVEGETGVVVYGEIAPVVGRAVGYKLTRGEPVGYVTPVLKVNKGRPMSMLHLELHDHGARNAYDWPREGPRPKTLRDPTPFLLEAVDAGRRAADS